MRRQFVARSSTRDFRAEYHDVGPRVRSRRTERVPDAEPLEIGFVPEQPGYRLIAFHEETQQMLTATSRLSSLGLRDRKRADRRARRSAALLDDFTGYRRAFAPGGAVRLLASGPFGRCGGRRKRRKKLGFFHSFLRIHRLLQKNNSKIRELCVTVGDFTSP